LLLGCAQGCKWFLWVHNSEGRQQPESAAGHAGILVREGRLSGHPSEVDDSEVLRHSQIAVTMNIYSHVRPSLTRVAVDRLNTLLENAQA
jgi:hypothetical protein